MGACVQKDASDPSNQDIQLHMKISQENQKSKQQTRYQDSQQTKDQFVFLEDNFEEDEKRTNQINYSEKQSMIRYRVAQKLELEELRNLQLETIDQTPLTFNQDKILIIEDQTETLQKMKSLKNNESPNQIYSFLDVADQSKSEEILLPRVELHHLSLKIDQDAQQFLINEEIQIIPLSARNFENNEDKYIMERSFSSNSPQIFSKSILKKKGTFGSGCLSSKKVTFEVSQFQKTRIEQLNKELRSPGNKRPQRKRPLNRDRYSYV